MKLIYKYHPITFFILLVSVWLLLCVVSPTFQVNHDKGVDLKTKPLDDQDKDDEFSQMFIGANDNELPVEKRHLQTLPGRFQSRIEPGLLVVNRANGQLINIFPGLLEETLLSKGSFEFGNRLVRFDKLKVLGNVYVNKINGKTLKETYQLRTKPSFSHD